MQVVVRFTVFFEKPFWVGVYEREEENRIKVSKVVFGAEPKDYDIYSFFLHNFTKLKFSPPVFSNGAEKKKKNPKRMQREITHQLNQNGIGTKAQQAVKLRQEQSKTERKVNNKIRKDKEKELQFLIRTEKKKQKHKGK